MVISENNKKIIYSLLVFPFPVTGIPILVYILPFYASNYNLGLSLVGLIFFAGRIIDVFTDPIMGALVDRYLLDLGNTNIGFSYRYLFYA